MAQDTIPQPLDGETGKSVVRGPQARRWFLFLARSMKMKKICALIVCMTALCGAVLFAQTNADEWLEKAHGYFDNGDYANAVMACGEAVKRNSSNLDAYWIRSFAHYKTKNYDAAIADCDTVIKGAPDFPFVYVLRGDAYGAKGVYHKAVADYRTGFEKGFEPNGFDVDKSSKASMWFCGAMYMEIVTNRFLGKPAVVTAYENRLKTVCDKSGVTRAEVEAFYRQNIGSLIAAVVDAEFGRVSFLLKNTSTSHNAVLTLDIKNKQYILSYEGYYTNAETRTLSASTLAALLSEMRDGRYRTDFDQTGRDLVQSQAALMPAAQLGNESLEDIKAVLAGFYANPNSRTYNMLKDVYVLYENFWIRSANKSFGDIARAYISTVLDLSQPLAQKVDDDVSRSRVILMLSNEQQRKLTSIVSTR
jgi:hypothetical protein